MIVEAFMLELVMGGRMIQDLMTFQVMVQALHIGQDIEGSVSEDLSGCEGDGNAVAVGLGI
jgi:hypothetical protein